MQKILIVDDDTVLSGLLQMTLELEGYHVETAADGKIGLAMASGQHWDLIILDLVMPQIDGIRFLRVLADRGVSRPPIMLLSSALDNQNVEQFRDLGVVDAARKPVEPDRLIAIVGRILGTEG